MLSQSMNIVLLGGFKNYCPIYHIALKILWNTSSVTLIKYLTIFYNNKIFRSYHLSSLYSRKMVGVIALNAVENLH